MRLPESIRRKLPDVPDEPGCYTMRDRHGRIIYVGKAASLRKRLGSYFREATLRKADPKLRSLLKSVWDIEWLVVRNEAEALLTEGRLIKEYKPRYNVAFRDDKRFLMLRADPEEPFPQFRLCRFARDDGALYFGPYVSSPATRSTLDFVEKHYGIRKCSPRTPDASTYKHCINDIVRFCMAPCVGKASAEVYRDRFNEACAFLRGERPAVLRNLREKMKTASAGMDFEKAAALRDTLLDLEKVVRQKARVVATPEMRVEEARLGVEDLQKALGLERFPRRIECFDVSNISGTFSVASLVCAENGLPAPARYRRFRIRTVVGIDDPGMIMEVVKRRYARALSDHEELPDLVIVDGGLTQLRAARTALGELSLAGLPVIGLAKRLEEIYWRDPGEPLKLPADSRPLLVIRRLRDEAHRFALDYHRRLRNRRIRESLLDDVPGIGEARKQRLLEHFGSVRRLAEATEEQIANVPGMGYEMARLVRQHLTLLRKGVE